MKMQKYYGMKQKGDLIIFVGELKPKDESNCFYCTSFIKIKNNKILLLEEYWTKVVEPPTWRENKKIGCPINDLRQSLKNLVF